MTKWKDITVNGHKILWREEVKEGDRKGWSFGCADGMGIRVWNEDGQDTDSYTDSDSLVPCEPEVTHSGWINVYSASCSESHPTRKEATVRKSIMTNRLGLIRIDWLDNGTYTVTKEDV